MNTCVYLQLRSSGASFIEGSKVVWIEVIKLVMKVNGVKIVQTRFASETCGHKYTSDNIIALVFGKNLSMLHFVE